MVQAAWAAARTKDSYFHAQFVRLRARRGPKKAIIAVAASILTAVYHILKDGTEHRDLGADHVIDVEQEDLRRRVRDVTGGRGADVCIEAVGNPKVLEQCFFARDLAGTVVQVGVPDPSMKLPDLPMIEFFGRGGALKPSWYGDCLPSRDFPMPAMPISPSPPLSTAASLCSSRMTTE